MSKTWLKFWEYLAGQYGKDMEFCGQPKARLGFAKSMIYFLHNVLIVHLPNWDKSLHSSHSFSHDCNDILQCNRPLFFVVDKLKISCLPQIPGLPWCQPKNISSLFLTQAKVWKAAHKMFLLLLMLTDVTEWGNTMISFILCASCRNRMSFSSPKRIKLVGYQWEAIYQVNLNLIDP